MALKDTASGHMQGIGLTMEGIAQNPVIYELMMQHAWQQEPISPGAWLQSYILNRYGYLSPGLIKAWDILRQTVYNGKLIRDGAESIITGRPTLDSTTVWTRTALNYPPADLLPAWDLLVEAARTAGTPEIPRGTAPPKNTDGFQFDLVDITRQVLANYAQVLQKNWVQAFRSNDSLAFNQGSKAFISLIADLDHLLSTRKDFLLGPWLADARHKGTTPQEQALYESNARDLITLWGDANSPLHEYANRQWSGLLNDFYCVRWEKFFAFLREAQAAGIPPDFGVFENSIRQWEWSWVHEQKTYPVSPVGDPVSEAKKIYDKYRPRLTLVYGK
jgi:alpha-N-acetylglucosaminidase